MSESSELKQFDDRVGGAADIAALRSDYRLAAKHGKTRGMRRALAGLVDELIPLLASSKSWSTATDEEVLDNLLNFNVKLTADELSSLYRTINIEMFGGGMHLTEHGRDPLAEQEKSIFTEMDASEGEVAA